MRILISAIFALFLISSCDSASQPETTATQLRNISYSSFGNIEIGNYDSTQYQNNYFGFSILNPGDNWTVLHQEKYKGNQNHMDDYDSTTMIFTDLFTVAKSRTDLLIPNYQTVSFMSEKLGKISNVNDALQYVKYTEKSTNGAASINFPKYKVTQIDTGMVGDRIFLRSKVKIESEPNNYFFEDMYTAQFGDYVLNISVSYKTPEDSVSVYNVLSKVKWNKI